MKMIKKFLLWILMGLFLISFASAFDTDALVFYHSYDTNANDYFGIHNGSVDGATHQVAGCARDGCYSFDGNDVINVNDHVDIDFPAGDFAISFWAYSTDTGSQDYFYQKQQQTSPFQGYMASKTTSEFLDGAMRDVGNNQRSATGNDYIGTAWSFYVVSYNLTNNEAKVYVNGTFDATGDFTAVTGSITNAQALSIGNNPSKVNGVVGRMDEFVVYDSTLDQTNITELWNGGTPFEYFGTTTPIPTFVAPTPNDGVTNNTQVNISLTCFGNITLWFNGTNPPVEKVIDNVPSPTSWLTNVTTEETYYYLASCLNATTGASANTTLRNWTYDTSEPTINLNLNNMFDNNNYSLVNQYLNESRLNMTFNDNLDLFGYRINITRNGVVYYNETNTTITGTEYNYTKFLDITSWEAGIYNISVLVADSHTQGKIKDYKVTKGFKKLYFDTAEGNKIKLDFNDDVYTDTKKLKDRYTFILNFSDGLTKNRTFTIKADTPIVYRQDSQYQGHFIVWNKDKGNWIDFVGSSSPPTITKTDEKKYDIFFENLPPYIEFNSIGGLNTKEINYTWYRGNYTLGKELSFIGEPTFLELNITTDVSIKDINATLYYNGTKYNFTNKTNHTTFFQFRNEFTAPANSGVYNFYWEVTTLQGSFNTTTFNISSNQTILQFAINNCSVTNLTTAIFNIRDEQNPEDYLNATLEIDARFWITSPDNSRNFTQEFDLNETHILCINNVSVTIFADMYIKYVVPNAFTHRYYIFNTSFNSTPRNYTLYNFENTTGKSTLAVNIRNRDTYENYVDVYTYLERRYIGDGVWRVVQMGLSDDFGNSYYNIIEKDADYRIILKDYGDNVLYRSANYNFNCIADICSIIFKILPFDGSIDNAQLNVVTDYNNDTQILTITFEDLTFLTSSVTALVTKETGRESIELCKETRNSHAGTISCNLTSYTGEVLVQVFATASPEDDKYSEWIDLGRRLLAQALGNDEAAFMSAGLYFVVALAGVSFGAAAGVIMAIIATAVLVFFQIFNALTITALIIIAALGIAVGIIVRR